MVETTRIAVPRLRDVARFTVRLGAAAATLYALGVYAYFAARLLVGERWWLVGLGSSLMPPLLLPATVLLVVFLLLRRWGTAGLLLPAVIAFVALYGGQLLPRGASAAPGAPELRVLTFNLRSQMDNAAEILDVIRSSDADVIALQEFTQTLALTLAPALMQDYPHQALYPSDSFAVGQGVFSRYPIVEEMMWQAAFYNQRVRIVLDDTHTVTLYNVHPPPPRLLGGFDTSTRSSEIADLLQRAAGETGAVILAGDFNTTDQTDDYRLITARYTDAFRAVGWGLGASFPNYGESGLPFRGVFRYFMPPLIRIDYIFHSNHLEPLQAYTLPSSGGSDHYPVLAWLQIED